MFNRPGRCALFFSLLLAADWLHADDLRWAAPMVGNPVGTQPVGARGEGVAVDTAGNICTTGWFGSPFVDGTVDFDPGPGTHVLTAAHIDVFISRLDDDGNFLWAARLGGSDYDAGTSVDVDQTGNVHTVGYFSGTADFDPGPTTLNLTSAGLKDAFIWKLDSDGNFLWARSLGGSADDEALDVAVDAAGNVYTLGSFSGTADFDPGPGTVSLTSAGETDIFLTKLDAAGVLVWAVRMGGLSYDTPERMTLDAAGNVYTVGWFQGTADFDPAPGGSWPITAVGTDTFISKIDATGALVWARSFSNSRAHAVAVDESANVYTVGDFVDGADFDPGPGAFPLSGRAFVSKLDGAGAFVWARALRNDNEGVLCCGDIWPTGVVVDGFGTIHMVGTHQGTTDFDPGPDTFWLSTPRQYLSQHEDNSFILRLDAAGDFEWAGAFPTADIYQSANYNSANGGAALDGEGGLITSGHFRGVNDFDPNPPVHDITSAGLSGYIVKLDTSAVGAGDIDDTLDVRLVAGSRVELSWNPSCAGTDDDYAVYEGTIRAWTSHMPVACTTGGAGTITFDPAPGNMYYLVVPRNSLREGSYGTTSGGTPRPQAAAACVPQQIAPVCP